MTSRFKDEPFLIGLEKKFVSTCERVNNALHVLKILAENQRNPGKKQKAKKDKERQMGPNERESTANGE
jgi:hypothetical protein